MPLGDEIRVTSAAVKAAFSTTYLGNENVEITQCVARLVFSIVLRWKGGKEGMR